MRFWKPFLGGEDQESILWQVLLQVVNHGGTDHRAHMLRALHRPGVKTTCQDYLSHVYYNPSLAVPGSSPCEERHHLPRKPLSIELTLTILAEAPPQIARLTVGLHRRNCVPALALMSGPRTTCSPISVPVPASGAAASRPCLQRTDRRCGRSIPAPGSRQPTIFSRRSSPRFAPSFRNVSSCWPSWRRSRSKAGHVRRPSRGRESRSCGPCCPIPSGWPVMNGRT